MSEALSFDQRWEALQTELLQRVEEKRAERLSQVPERALDWLALTPVWTLGLARACGFPSDGTDVRETLQRIESLGLCRSAPPPVVSQWEADAEPDPSLERFWMSSDQRSQHLARALRSGSRSSNLQEEIGDLAESILAARQQGVTLLPILDCWATLAAQKVPYHIGQRLLDEAGQAPPAQAVRWLEAARPLEEILKGELTAAFTRAVRRLEYRDRREVDLRLLTKYVKRPEQLRDFDELLQGPDDRWALHYIGAGGVGKTMLMRYLSVHRIPELGGSSARIDFDYINPDYPSRAPGILLVQLAEELRLQAPRGAAEDLFSSFFSQITTLHEQLTAKDLDEDPISSSAFEIALGHLVEAMQRLPQPVVLLVDTCEELSKIQLDGTIPRNVADTFRILEKLHDRYVKSRAEPEENVLVVFCGRRLLASAGYGWSVPETPHPERDYLRLHVMRGFDRQEAESLLDRFKVPERLREPILKQSPLLGFSLAGTGRAAPRHEEQYSPYSLDLHANWAQENPDLLPEEILDKRVDPFVRIRILRRLRPALSRLLPAIALLGRFDQDTLLAATQSDPQDFAELFRELADQEWATRQSGFVEVERELRPRLLAHVQNTHAADLERVRRPAIDHLKRKIVRDSGEVPSGEINPLEIEVALRLMRPFPEEAAEWWERLELGLARGAAPEWTEDLSRRLLAEEVGEDSPLRAAVAAALAAALHRARRKTDTVPLWQEVLTTADRHPRAEGVQRLWLRALAGLVGAGALGVSDLAGEIWKLPPPGLDAQLAASVVAAVERSTERLEEGTGSREEVDAFAELAGSLIARVQKLDPGLSAFLRTLAARLCLLQGRGDKARDHFGEALGVRKKIGTPRKGWIDWAAPDDLSARIALEFVRGAWARILPARAVHDKLEKVPGSHDTLDGDRLESARLQVSAALSVPDLSALEPTGIWHASEDPVCHAQRRFPPSAVTAALTLGEAGQIKEALGHLALAGGAIETAAGSYGGVLDAERAHLHLALRMRLRPHEGPSPGSPVLSASYSPSDGILAARWLATLPPSLRSGYPVYESRFWLRNRPLLSERNLGIRLLEQMDRSAAPEQLETLEELERAVEILELARLAQANRVPLPLPPTREVLPDWKDLLLRLTPSDRVAAELLRAWSLTDRLRHAIPDAIAERLGQRRAAWIAFDEGSVLALRVSAGGLQLLELACRCFHDLDDPVGLTLGQTALTLARCRGGDRKGLDAMGHVRDSYERCREQFSLLPWSDLRDLVRRAAVSPEDLGPSHWHSWMLRIAACLAWKEDGARAGRCTQSVVAALAEAFGGEGEGLLPPELDFLLREAEPRLEKAPRPGAKAVHLFGDELADTGVPGPVRLSLSSQGKLEAWPIPTGPLPLRVEGRLTYRAAGQGGGRVDYQRIDYQEERTNSVWLKPGFGPYRESAQDFLQLFGLREALRSLPDPQHELELRIELELPLAGIAWEALLALGAFSDPAHLPGFRRTLTHASRKERPLRSPVKLLSFGPTLAELRMSEAGWEPLRSDPRFRQESLGSEKLMYSPDLDPSVQVFHLVGRPISTTAGARMEITEVGLANTVGRGQILAARDLLYRLPEARLILLQANPKRSPERSGSDREKAAYLRVMAAELHAGGIPAVLTIPPLHEDLGAAVLRDIAEALRKPASSLAGPLLDALAAARLRIRESVSPLSEEGRLEQALDLTFYGSDTIDWKLPKEGA